MSARRDLGSRDFIRAFIRADDRMDAFDLDRAPRTLPALQPRTCP